MMNAHGFNKGTRKLVCWSPVETRAPQSNEISCMLWDAETKPMPKKKNCERCDR